MSVCEHVARIRSAVDELMRRVESVSLIIDAFADAYVVCCVVVAVACVADGLLLRMLRARGLFPVRRTFVVTHDDVGELDAAADLTDARVPVARSLCDGNAIGCVDPLLPLNEMQPPQFSETKV